MIGFPSTDDRKNPVAVPARFLIDLCRAGARSIGPVRPRRLPRLLLRLVTTGPFLVGSGALALASIVATWMVRDTSVGLGMLVFSPVWVPAFTMVLITGRGALGLGGSLAADIQTTLLIERRCPACGFDLAGSEEQPDGCVTCPECGAGWRARRLGNGGLEPEIVVLRDAPAGATRRPADAA